MPIFDHTAFTTAGAKFLPRAEDFAPLIDEQIAEDERALASKWFGAQFYEALLNDVLAGGVEPRWTALYNGVNAYDENRYYEGFDGFSYFLFFFVVRNGLTNISDNTVTAQYHENSRMVRGQVKLTPAWNKGVDWYFRCVEWIKHNGMYDFSEFAPIEYPEKINIYDV